MSRPLRWALGVLVAVLLTGLLVTLLGVRPDDLRTLQLRPGYLALAWLLYLPCVLLRALRMMRLETPARARRLGLLRMSAALAAHAAANHILPMRLGELTYASLARAATGMGMAQSLGVTLLMRLSDLFGLGAVLGISLALASLPSPTVRLPLALGALLLCLGGLGGLLWGGRLLAWLLRPLRGRLRGRIERAREALVESLQRFADRPGELLAVAALSLLLWGGLVAVHWSLGQSVGLDLSPPQMAIAALGSILVSFLPVGSVLNLGTAEAGWVATLALVGVRGPEAFALGLGVHLGLVAATALTGLFGLGVLARERA